MVNNADPLNLKQDVRNHGLTQSLTPVAQPSNRLKIQQKNWQAGCNAAVMLNP
jgi:hypothetical protein